MMPKFIGNDSLIARINEVEGCMYRQSNELGRLNKAVRRYKSENVKLRELVVRMRPICMEGQRCAFADRIYINNIMEELGIRGAA